MVVLLILYSGHSVQFHVLKRNIHIVDGGSLAEWSKALVLGTSLKGRGFESHSCQKIAFLGYPAESCCKKWAALGEARTHNPGIACTVL